VIGLNHALPDVHGHDLRMKRKRVFELLFARMREIRQDLVIWNVLRVTKIEGSAWKWSYFQIRNEDDSEDIT